jgi:hypothetical protein
MFGKIMNTIFLLLATINLTQTLIEAQPIDADGLLSCVGCHIKQDSIHCPAECDMIDTPIINPSLTPENHICPSLMCEIECVDGFSKDKNGCDTCICEETNYPRILGSDPVSVRCSMIQLAIMNQCISDCHLCDMINTQIILDHCITEEGLEASTDLCDPETTEVCPIPYTTCNSQYVCPKVTEVTQCSHGGISGYTTYQLSLVINNQNVRNIYAVYGDDQPTVHPMNIPPAFQGSSIFNTNLGGISNELIAINSDARFDSWLTIGLTNGDPQDKLAAVGIDFQSWTESTGIHTTNGAIYVMNPDEVIVQGNEIIVAQLTIPSHVTTSVVMNVQGKLHCKGCAGINNSWKQEEISFLLEQPRPNHPNVVPMNCLSWYDGCNTCSVRNGQLGSCTRTMCFTEDVPRCLLYDTTPGH